MIGVFEIVESMWITVESSASLGENQNHRMVVKVSDIVVVVSSTALLRLLTIADTMSQSDDVRHASLP